MKTILHGGQYLKMDDNGLISRPEIKMPASGQWKVTGAVRLNNFGYVVERFSLDDIINDRIPDYQYKNGKQKVHITDLDHGTHRTWMSPNHKVYRGQA